MYSMLDLFAGVGGLQVYPSTLEDFNVDDEQCINSVFCDFIFEIYRDGISDMKMRNIFDDVYYIATQIVTQKRPYHKYEEYVIRAGNCTYIKEEEGRKIYSRDNKRMYTVFSIVHSLLSFHGYDGKPRIKQVMDRITEVLIPSFEVEFLLLNSRIKRQNASVFIKRSMKNSTITCGATKSTKQISDEARKYCELAIAFSQAEESWLAEKKLLQTEVDKIKKEEEKKRIKAISSFVTAIVEVGEAYPSSSNDKAEVIRSLLLEKAVFGHIPAEVLTNNIRERIYALGRKENPVQIGTMKVENLNDIHDNRTVNYGSKG